MTGRDIDMRPTLLAESVAGPPRAGQVVADHDHGDALGQVT
jgi:hypothetical protein